MIDLILHRPLVVLALTALLWPVPGLARQIAPDQPGVPRATTWVPDPAVASAASPAAPAHLAAPPAPAVRDTSPPAPCPLVLDLGAGDLSGPLTEYARAAELAGVAPLRSRLNRRTSDEARLQICAPPEQVPWARKLRPNLPEDGLSVEVIKPFASLSRHSTYPDDRNNGALWAGRGANVQATAGVAFRWGALSGAILPTFAYQENLGFETVTSIQLPGYSTRIYPWHPGRIDWPQRFGTGPILTYDPGQSYLRYEDRGLALTLSTENLWWGPAQRYPLLLGNTAPGFMHLAFGTARPHDLRFAALEARALWGRLEESEHFDSDPANDSRLFAGFSAELQPYALPGLYLGFSRVHVLDLDGLALHRQFLAPFWSMGGDDGSYTDHPGYRLLSVSGRWVFPEAGFEAYAEWATRARWTGLSDFLREPGRGQAYLLGFQHLSPHGRLWVRTYGEIVQLAGSPKLPRDGGPISFYTDPRVPQGHTHRGQLLGAAIGPGSDAQILGLDLITPWTTIGVFAERTRRDEDAYFTIWTRYYGRDGHDVALRAGVRQNLFLGPFSIGWALTTEDRRNRNLLRLDGTNWNLLREHDLEFQASVGWRPGSARHALRPAVLAARRGR